MSKFSRFKSLSEEQAQNTLLDFVFIIVNTLFVPFLVAVRYENFVPAQMIIHITWWVNIDDEPENYFDDLNKGWYENVGYNFLFSMFFSITTPIIRNFAGWLVRKLNARKLKKAKCQIQAKRLCKKPEFDLGKRYATSLLILTICWIFACGMPMLTLAGCLLFTITYFMDKQALIRHSSTTSKSDSTIHTWLCDKLRTIQIFHILFSLVMLTVPAIFNPVTADSPEGMKDLKEHPISFKRFIDAGNKFNIRKH